MRQLATDRLGPRMHAICKIIDNGKQQNLAWLELQVASLVEKGEAELLEDGSSDVDCQHERSGHYYYASLKLNKAHQNKRKRKGKWWIRLLLKLMLNIGLILISNV